MKRTKKILALAFALVMVLGILAGCSGKNSDDTTDDKQTTNDNQTAGDKDTTQQGNAGNTSNDSDAVSSKDELIMRMDSDPGTLDNLTTAIMNGSQILSIVNCPLLSTSYDEKMNIVYSADTAYSLATSYEYADDNSYIIWTIRDNATWTDGSPVTAEDVVYSIKRYEVNSRYNYIDYTNVTAESDNSIKVGFLKPNANAVTDIGSMTMVQKAAHESLGNEEYFTTESFQGIGAWNITEWVSGDHMTLEAKDNYFGGTPKIKTITIRFIPEASVAMMELETGGMDIIDIPNWTDVSNVMNGQYEGVAKHFSIPDALHTMIGYNLSPDSPCQDLRVRQAIAYALDRDVIAVGAYEGVGQVAYSIFSSALENMRIFTSEEWPYKQDVEKAKELLADAGYADGFEMTILTNQDANRSMAAQIVKNQLAEIGITANIVNYDNATYAATMSGETDSWDIWLRNWTAANVWSAMINNTIVTNCHPDDSDETWQKYLNWSNEMLEELDTEKRYAIEDELQENYLTEALYTYNLIEPVKHVILSDNLMNAVRCGYAWSLLDAYFE